MTSVRARAAYARRKRQPNNTLRDCAEAGFDYMPVVWEAEGGEGTAAHAVVTRCAAAIATTSRISTAP